MFTQNHQLKRIQACEKEIKSHGNFFEKKNGKIEKHTWKQSIDVEIANKEVTLATKKKSGKKQ